MIAVECDPHVLWVVVMSGLSFIKRRRLNRLRDSTQPILPEEAHLSLGTIFIFLHILTMFIAVALTVGSEQLLRRVAATENVAAIRMTFGVAA